jgi:Lrp/AsnC family leucine-responsive transcriptional regulator
VSIGHPKAILAFEEQIHSRPDVLECHHVTGGYTLLLKVKTENTRTLEELISHIRSFEGVERTETMVVLSTHTERAQMLMQPDLLAGKKRARRSAEKLVLQGNTAS